MSLALAVRFLSTVPPRKSYTTSSLSIHLLIDTKLILYFDYCKYVTVNIDMNVSFQICVFKVLSQYPEVKLLDHKAVLFLFF